MTSAIPTPEDRLAAARRRVEEKRRRRAELAEARRYGLAARNARKLRATTDRRSTT